MKNKIKKDNIKNYLLFRIAIEDSIDDLRIRLKDDLKLYKDKIVKIPNISVQKIEFYTTLYKKNFKSVEKTTNEVFDTLINQFDYIQTSMNYKANETIIKEYILKSLAGWVELQEFRKSKRFEIKSYREENKGQINFNAAENSFVEMRRNMKHINEENYLEDLKECREVVDSLIKEKNPATTAFKTIKLEKPKKQKPYKMTEAEIIQMMFSNKEIKEQLNQL